MTKTISWGIIGAAEEVVRMYGLENELKTISCGEYLE